MRFGIDFERISYEDLDSAYHQIREKWIQRTTDRLASQIRKEVAVTDLNFHYHDDIIVYNSNGKMCLVELIVKNEGLIMLIQNEYEKLITLKDVDKYIQTANIENLKEVQKLLDLRQKRLVLSQYEERLNNILNEIRALGYNIFMDNWFEETFDEIRFGIQADDPMDICIDFSHN
jgi:hypothetical protein